MAQVGLIFMAAFFFFFFFFFLLGLGSSAEDIVFVGVNIGTELSDMPHPTQTVALLKAQRIRHVRLYDADPGLLLALANTGIQVAVSIPNDQILGIGQSNATASNWVSQNVLAHYPSTNITTICVGSEVISSLPNAAPVLVPALRYVSSALSAANLEEKIKVSTPLPSSVILDSFPPSQAFFNASWNRVVILPLLQFLQSTGSPLMLNVYPYHDYMQSNGVIPLDYALFQPLRPKQEALDSNTLLRYTNVFDAVVDAAYFAMADLNFTNIPVLVTESGWPSKGDPSNEPDATMDNADTYNSNLIKHVLNRTGTPKHPNAAVSTYIYELYNEDLKPGGGDENWGLFDQNGNPVYVLHLTDSGTVLANDTTNNTYCAARPDADRKLLQAALDWACGPGRVDCSPLLQGNACYDPDNVVSHATYAFDAYYHRMGKAPETCDFNGVAEITTSDPTHGSCLFPAASGGVNGSFANATAPSMSSTATSSTGVTTPLCAGFFSIGLLLCSTFL